MEKYDAHSQLFSVPALFAARSNTGARNAVRSNRCLATGWETAGSATRTERWAVEFDAIH